MQDGHPWLPGGVFAANPGLDQRILAALESWTAPLSWANSPPPSILVEFETDAHRAEVEALRTQIAALTAERDRAQRLAGEARALLESWYHDPDCSVGRRELQHFEGEKVCAHFKERWRHQCAEALLAVLGGAEPDGEAVGPSES